MFYCQSDFSLIVACRANMLLWLTSTHAKVLWTVCHSVCLVYVSVQYGDWAACVKRTSWRWARRHDAITCCCDRQWRVGSSTALVIGAFRMSIVTGVSFTVCGLFWHCDVTMNDNRVVWLQKHSVIGKNLSDHVANYGQQEILVEQSFVNDYEVKHLVGFSRR